MNYKRHQKENNYSDRCDRVLYKSLKDYKIYQKVNNRFKFYSNKIMLCGGKGQHYIVLKKINVIKWI